VKPIPVFKISWGTRNDRDRRLQARPKDAAGVLLPFTVAAVIAVVGTVSLFLMDFGPWSSPPGDGNGMTSAAVVYRAGATRSAERPYSGRSLLAAADGVALPAPWRHRPSETSENIS
jgi:hypothetical protein